MAITLPFSLPRLTAIIGGGGKTTLLFRLGRQLAAQGAAVLLTTTTHLAWPPPEDVLFCAPASEGELFQLARPGQLVLAGYSGEDHRMTGLPEAWLKRACSTFDYVLCEADGSRGLPLKWHREGEPCLPAETGLVLAVAGLSALDRPAGAVMHRWERSGLAEEHRITEEDVVLVLRRMLEHSGWTGPAACLLNQADNEEIWRRGERIARAMRMSGTPCAVCALQKDVMGCWY